MKPNIIEIKTYLKEDAINCSFELGWTVSWLNDAAHNSWDRFKNLSIRQDNSKFKQQLTTLLSSKLNEMTDLKITDIASEKMNIEMHRLLACSLASNRTPDEIISGLRSDAEMRSEVVDLLISRIKPKTAINNQRLFLNRVLSGDNDLLALLRKQQEKKGFPHNI